ncbi:MAG TPA: molybdopterin-dependent oxidoreductase [Terriglobia bacterium]|nr:molybdopterin-dependent oxidoreductase [Terriglobia bacterium]
MRRRQFLLSAAGASLVSARRLWADHHIVSWDPLVVVFDLSSLQGRYTRVEDFYIRNHHEAPANALPMSLRIEGEVAKPQEVSSDRLKVLPVREIGAVLECAGDPVRAISLVSDGIWRGWRLEDIISLARPQPAGAYLHLFGHDGFSRSVPLDRAVSDGWLVTQLNGRPLLRDHGAPWRALFPGWYGMDSVKWLEKIVVATSPLPPVGNTYLEMKRDPSGNLVAQPLPPLRVKSVITAPASGAVVQRGKMLARGLAWSGAGKIKSVQVSADGGTTWQPAALDESASRYDWALWTSSLDLSRPGVVELVVKATDAAGNSQPEQWPSNRVDLYAYNVCDRIRCVVV